MTLAIHEMGPCLPQRALVEGERQGDPQAFQNRLSPVTRGLSRAFTAGRTAVA